MERKKINIRIAGRQNSRQLSLEPAENLAHLDAGIIRNYLKKIITQRNVHLEIDLSGVHEIDNHWFDTFNFLSRLGRKYNSALTLTGVEPGVMEIIDLIRKYYFFDIRVVEPA